MSLKVAFSFWLFYLLGEMTKVLNVLQRLFHLLDFLLFGFEVPVKLLKSSARHVPIVVH